MKHLWSLGGRKALVFSVALVVLAFALFSIAGYAMCQAILTHSAFRYSRIARGDVHVNILIAGNSRGVNLMLGRRASDPPSAFNLSFNGESYPSTFGMIQTYFQRGNTAKYVVIEASTLIMEGENCKDKPYWHLYPLLYAAERAGCSSDDSAMRYFPLTGFNSELFLRAMYYLALKPHGDQSWANEYSIPAQLCHRLPLEHLQAMRRDALAANREEIRRQIAQLGNWLHTHGYKTDVIFVLGPFYYGPRSADAVGDIEKVTEDLLGHGTWLNLASALGSNCDNYADAVHAGRKGRAEILPLILKYLNSPKT